MKAKGETLKRSIDETERLNPKKIRSTKPKTKTKKKKKKKTKRYSVLMYVVPPAANWFGRVATKRFFACSKSRLNDTEITKSNCPRLVVLHLMRDRPAGPKTLKP